MDKLKVFLAVMKKQHFWVMTGLALVVGLVGWAWATSTLSNEYRTNRNKIEGTFKDLDQLRSQDRENADWIKGVQGETVHLKAKVKAAWEDVYAEQRDKVLRWPKVLGEDFLRTVPQLPPNEEIPVHQRERYWNYAREEFPRLLEIIDARSYLDRSDELGQAPEPRARPASKFGPPGVKPRPADDAEQPAAHDYKVFWDKEDQQAIDKHLEWNDTPTTQEVRQTQEDLWVYQTLLTIIKHLNDRADGRHNAKVKEIRSLLIGREAALRFQAGMAEGRIEHPESPLAQTGGPGGPGGPGMASKPKMLAPPAATPGMPPGQAKAADEGRYVDEKGMPLAAGAAAPPEFKRMPIFMQLLFDQREISRLLVECANSPLPIEVRQLRVSPAEPGTTMVGGRPAHNAGLKLTPGPGAGRGGRPQAANNSDDERDKNPYDVVVELQGIIYIFNPPDQTKLAPAATDEPTTNDAASGDAATGDGGATAPADEAADATPAQGQTPAAEGSQARSTDATETDAADTDAEEPAAEASPDGEKPEAGQKQPDDEAMDDKATDTQ